MDGADYYGFMSADGSVTICDGHRRCKPLSPWKTAMIKRMILKSK
jgi:hypothetical protein